jgi:hypothetical protein
MDEEIKRRDENLLETMGDVDLSESRGLLQ